MIRNKKLTRAIALTLCCMILQNCLWPTVAFALTSGPFQTEYTAYESPGATDMVNLITGDFTHSVPILSVPGPEGSFDLPLSYHSGIGVEQEASWVGLGFSINAGAITRNVVQYPDDAQGEILETENNDPGGRGWNVNTIFFGNYGWDSEKGHGGNIGFGSLLNGGYGFNSGDVTLLGVTRKESGDIQADPVDVAMSVASVVSYGLSAAGTESATAVASSLDAISTAYSLYSLGRGLSEGNYSGVYNKVSVKSRNYIVYQKYKYWLDAMRQEKMYGVLHLGKMNSQPGVQPTGSQHEPPLDDHIAHPYIWNGAYGQGSPQISPVFDHEQNSSGTFVAEASSDIHMHIQDNDYYYGSSPVSLAVDNFSVMGNGISGSIQPYRLDVGSVAFPKSMQEKHYKYDVVPFEDYKVGFRYLGSKGNRYKYHLGSTYTSGDLANIQEFGLGYFSDNTIENSEQRKFNLILQDPSFYDPALRTEGNREGLVDNKLASGKWVEWFTNEEIASTNASTNAVSKGFIDFASGQNGSRATFRNARPASGIGGYSITREDGMTFHFALPMYNWSEFNYGGKVSDTNKNSLITRNDPFATTWLLTAITGPDFVDQGEVGILDEGDQGYWVKMEYGRFSTQYKWRTPYWKNAYAEDDMDTETYSTGYKETYYLNSVSTRTHTALFVKSERKDGRGHYSRDTHLAPPDPGINDQNPSSALKLDEIILLQNADYKTLTTDNAIASGLLAFSKNSGQNNAILGNGDTFNDVIDVYDLTKDARYVSFVHQKALRRTVMNYSYRLCANTTNSFASATAPPSLSGSMTTGRLGKLTLESITFYGAQDIRLMPDYVFNYGFNPDYDFEKWDGWGMYNRNGQRSLSSHKSSTYDEDGAAWCLTEILTPLGSKLTVTYERDEYASVNGRESNYLKITSFDKNTNRIFFDVSSLGGHSLSDFLGNGQSVTIENLKAQQQNHCWDCCGDWNWEYDYPIESSQTVAGVNSNSFVIDVPATKGGFCNERVLGVCVSECNGAYWYSMEGGIYLKANKKGGDVRVARITVSNGTVEYKTRYVYTENGQPGGVTSGVVSSEPIFIDKYEYDFYNLFDQPSTPVLYGKVTVLNGALTNDQDFKSKTEYSYVTPSYTMIDSQSDSEVDHLLRCRNIVQGVCFYFQFLEQSDYYLDIGTDLIGQVRSVKGYDARNQLVNQTSFNYATTDQGEFTEGAILAENYLRPENFKATYRIARTKKRYTSTVLKSVVSIDNSVSTGITFGNFDFLTGEALETRTTSSMGVTTISRKTPAYTLPGYASMRSKAYAVGNKNMLDQEAVTQHFKLSGSEELPLGGSVVRWKNDWSTYRYFNTGAGAYQGQGATPVWRAHERYLWQSQAIQPDGAIGNFAAYDWSPGAANSGWVRAGEVTQYNHFSKTQGISDVNGNKLSAKYGYGDVVAIASATNAAYGEMAYSGAEDKVAAGSSFYFGGEVGGGDKQDATYYHTGKYSVKLNGGELGFTHKALIGTDLEAGRQYRASVWIHASDLTAGGGKVFAEAGATSLGTVDIKNAGVKQAGDWYLANLYFDVPAGSAGQTLTVGCRNTGTGTVYFDDFRFQPVDGTMVSYVYDPASFQITHVLDNNNLYQRYEYDAAGRVVKTYKEVLTAIAPEKLMSSTQYNFARMKTPQWQDTGNKRCVIGTDGGNTGEQEKEQKDTNPGSAGVGQTRWVPAGYNIQACAPCVGIDKKIINGVCETGTREYTASYPNGSQYTCEYHYIFSDGSATDTFQETNDFPCAI